MAARAYRWYTWTRLKRQGIGIRASQCFPFYSYCTARARAETEDQSFYDHAGGSTPTHVTAAWPTRLRPRRRAIGSASLGTSPRAAARSCLPSRHAAKGRKAAHAWRHRRSISGSASRVRQFGLMFRGDVVATLSERDIGTGADLKFAGSWMPVGCCARWMVFRVGIYIIL